MALKGILVILNPSVFPSYGTVLQKMEMHGPAEIATRIVTENP